MAALASVLITIALSLFMTRIGARALMMTGLSAQAARFQARSAFTGVGFTTNEAERVVNHPVRRRIITLLMFLGNAGAISVISSLILTFVSAQDGDQLTRFLLLIIGLMLMWLVSVNRAFDRLLSRLIDRALKRWTHLDTRDYASLLHLSGEYRVTEMKVEPDNWMANKTLKKLQLRSEGVAVLAIEREDGTFVGAPDGSTFLRPGDVIVLYGRIPALTELDERRADPQGEKAHFEAIAEQERLEEEERAKDSPSRVDGNGVS